MQMEMEGKLVLDFHFELWVHIMESGYLYRGGKMCDTQEKSSDTGLLACSPYPTSQILSMRDGIE